MRLILPKANAPTVCHLNAAKAGTFVLELPEGPPSGNFAFYYT